MSIPPTRAGSPGEEPDPSMDDILASIRRILDDDQGAKPPGEDVLMLNPSMMVPAHPEASGPEIVGVTDGAREVGHREPQFDDGIGEHDYPAMKAPKPAPVFEPEEREHRPIVNDELMPVAPVARETDDGLVAPAAAAAAANSVGALMRKLAAERSAAVSRTGTTIEDLVREEVRPFLKDWLDQHLPPIVERLVQAEIERVVARQAG